MASPFYERLAGSSRERIAALSDGVFAIAMTLLVLELKLPERGDVQSDTDLLRALWTSAPHFAAYVMSFTTLAIFWSGQQAQLNALRQCDRTLSLLQIGFLAGVGLIPFATSLVGEYIELRVAIFVYWANLAFMGAWLYASWRYAVRTGQINADLGDGAVALIKNRLVRAQMLYLVCASIGIFSTHAGIGAMSLVQLLYALGPRNRLIAAIIR